MEQEFIEAAKGFECLGPNYFAARQIADRFMAQFESEQFKPLIDKLANEIRDKLWEDVSSWLLSDTESNLQSAMWHRIDETVKALLSGEEWALKHYALGDRYNHAKVREAIARHIPAELQDKRVDDLKAEVERLERDLKFYRERSY